MATTPAEIIETYKPYLEANGESTLLKKLMNRRWVFALDENIEKSLLVKSLPIEMQAIALPHMAKVYYEFFADKIVINIPIEGLATICYSIVEENLDTLLLDARITKEPYDKKSLKIAVFSENSIRIFDVNQPAALDHYLLAQ